MKASGSKKAICMMTAVFLAFALIVPEAWGEQTSWTCPECGRTDNTGNFCGSCGHPAPWKETMKQISVGSTVVFGRYEQDNDPANGPEEIEWIVLDYDGQGHRALLLSKYGLDSQPYDQTGMKTVWEKCSLRKWLNGEFLQSAFSKEQQDTILMTAVDNSQAQGYSEWKTVGGSQTKDQIFLLSYAEANRYLDVTYEGTNNIKARVTPTAYAIARGAYISSDVRTAEGKPAGWWWLRSPGRLRTRAADVSSEGSLSGRTITYDSGTVRPAFWVSLDSGVF